MGSSGWLRARSRLGLKQGNMLPRISPLQIALLSSTVGEGVFHKSNHSRSVTCGREHKGCGGFPSALVGGRSSQTIWLRFWKCPFVLIS